MRGRDDDEVEGEGDEGGRGAEGVTEVEVTEMRGDGDCMIGVCGFHLRGVGVEGGGGMTDEGTDTRTEEEGTTEGTSE